MSSLNPHQNPLDGEDLVHGVTHVRVRYAETDCSGVVYHANYLAFCEVGRTELMRELNFPYRSLEQEHSLVLPVVDTRIRFYAPARYDDQIRIETRITALGGARISFAYQLLRETDRLLLVDASTTLGCIVASTGRPRRLPASMADPLKVFLTKSPSRLPKGLL